MPAPRCWRVRHRRIAGWPRDRAGRGRNHESERISRVRAADGSVAAARGCSPVRRNGAWGGASEPAADEWKAKLEALAKLRQPEAVTPSEENGAARPDRVAKNDDIASGLEGPFSVKDYIRAQVERRWNPDLANLRNHEVSVPIHVEITSAGVVLKAEIVDTARAADPDFREIAVSARNAVLLSSPIALPAGHYQEVMDMVLYLNPKDALR